VTHRFRRTAGAERRPWRPSRDDTAADRKYSESHEWHKLDGDVVTLGITSFAVDQLTDLTFVEMKPAGTEVSAGDAVGEVESVKTTSDIYSGVAGEVIEANAALETTRGW
jgi:glycine cleavage system H protein